MKKKSINGFLFALFSILGVSTFAQENQDYEVIRKVEEKNTHTFIMDYYINSYGDVLLIDTLYNSREPSPEKASAASLTEALKRNNLEMPSPRIISDEVIAKTIIHSGDLLASGAKMKNTGLYIGITGAVVGSGLILAAGVDNKDLRTVGTITTATGGLLAIILQIAGNVKIKQAGINLSDTGLGIKYTIPNKRR